MSLPTSKKPMMAESSWLRSLSLWLCEHLRTHPGALFWLLACAAFAAGVAHWLVVMALLLVVQMSVLLHVARRTYLRPR